MELSLEKVCGALILVNEIVLLFFHKNGRFGGSLKKMTKFDL